MNTNSTQTRYIGKCHRCATRITTTEVQNIGSWNGKPWADIICPTCKDTRMDMRPIKGTASAKPCSKRCINATGVDCECECVGANHGDKWAA